MPSIYPQLKDSDRKHIRTEKARIRRQFSDPIKQEELISELYKKMLGTNAVAPKAAEPAKEVKAEKPKAEPKAKKAKKVAKVK